MEDDLLPLLVQNNRILGAGGLRFGAKHAISSSFRMRKGRFEPPKALLFLRFLKISKRFRPEVREYCRLKAPFEHSLLKQGILKPLDLTRSLRT